MLLSGYELFWGVRGGGGCLGWCSRSAQWEKGDGSFDVGGWLFSIRI